MKPTAKIRKPIMDYHEMIHFVEKKYNFDVRDYAGKHKRQSQWMTLTGKGLYNAPRNYAGNFYDRDNKKVSEDDYKKAFEDYRADSNEFAEWNKLQGELPYLDYWHYLTDRCFSEINNGSTAYWDVKDILENEDAPIWVKEITQKVYDEFKDDLDEDGSIEVLIEW